MSLIGSQRQLPRRRPVTLSRDQQSGGQKVRRHKPDYLLLVIPALMLVMGIVVVYSIGPGLAAQRGLSENYYVNKQIVAVVLGSIILAVAASMPLKWWSKLIVPLVVLSFIGSLIAQLTPVDEVYQAHRWVRFGGLSFQVAELIKVALLLWTASFLTHQWRLGKLHDFKETLRPILIALGIVTIVVAFLQSDLGSTAVMMAVVGAMLFVVGVPMRKLLLGVLVVSAAVALLIMTSSYRQDRILTFLNPERDCQNAGYQACQALITVGSGGITGLGLGQSVQAYGYLPEAMNDSIFAIMAEKFGFFGVSVIVSLYAILISRLKRIIEHSNDQFYRLVVVGILAWISTQAIINIGAMLGLLPLKGITLPFISSGGTSLVFLTLVLGVVFQISRYTTYSISEPELDYEDSQADNRSNGRGVRRTYNPSLISRPRV